jgi:hypothetical protein
VRKALARTCLSSENPGADGYRFLLPRLSGVSTLVRFQLMELESKRKIETEAKTETPAITPSEQPHAPEPPAPEDVSTGNA